MSIGMFFSRRVVRSSERNIQHDEACQSEWFLILLTFVHIQRNLTNVLERAGQRHGRL